MAEVEGSCSSDTEPKQPNPKKIKLNETSGGGAGFGNILNPVIRKE